MTPKRNVDGAGGPEDVVRPRDRIVFALKVDRVYVWDSAIEDLTTYEYTLESEIADVDVSMDVEQNLGWEVGDTLLMDLHLPGVGDEVLNDDGEPLEMG